MKVTKEKTWYFKITDGKNVRDFRYSHKYFMIAILDCRQAFADFYGSDERNLTVLVAKEIRTK